MIETVHHDKEKGGKCVVCLRIMLLEANSWKSEYGKKQLYKSILFNDSSQIISEYIIYVSKYINKLPMKRKTAQFTLKHHL